MDFAIPVYLICHFTTCFYTGQVVFATWSVLIEEKLGGTGIPDLFKHLRQLLRAVEEQNEYGYIYKERFHGFFINSG